MRSLADDLTPLRAGVPFPEMIQDVAQLRRCGDRYQGRCPFHEDSTPSLSVRRGRDGAWRWRCFGCGEGGDVIDWLARMERIPMGQAIRRLREDYGALMLAPPPRPAPRQGRGRAFLLCCDVCGTPANTASQEEQGTVYAHELPYVVATLRETGWRMGDGRAWCDLCVAGVPDWLRQLRPVLVAINRTLIEEARQRGDEPQAYGLRVSREDARRIQREINARRPRRITWRQAA